ncbi:hypothetical protein [Planococcus salinus]|uniref:Uncharacterized protein n=1 Tax=Planococcus salinus TaxID=1848460 RepID=A0A3M8PED4_9BACL|nr:hypothetical protein [Planococcus salinus]RNF41184.1 hypothetical protein EEX84_02210 [Planococcus salinus]
MDDKNKVEETYMSRQERERIGRQTNAGFARVERMEVEQGADDIPTGEVAQELSEEEIRRRVGEGNYSSAKDDRQTNSINS